MQLSKQQLELIRNYFQDKPVLKAYLFGSQARNEAHTDSDIDILLQLDYSQRIGLLFVQMQLELEKLLNKKVDLVSENGMSKYIQPIVEREKQLIYAKN